jgi:hypothetical protein
MSINTSLQVPCGNMRVWEEGDTQPGKGVKGDEKVLPEIVSRIDDWCLVKRGK